MKHETRDERLERVIAKRSADVERLQELSKKDSVFRRRLACDQKFWRFLQRDAARDVADLVALRSPEMVARLEAERGLT